MAIRRILLVGHTHHDVGYTNSPRLVDPLHGRIVEEVLSLAETYSDPGADQFRWTFEVARPVLRFLAGASAEQALRLRRLVRQQRVSVTAGYLNMTQLLSEAELDAAYDALHVLREAGITPRTEQHGDVNGIAWGAVEAMRRAGVSRLVMALNPDHGRPPLEQPSGFWWEGPAGSRVFVWLSTHYGVGEQWGIVDGDVELAEERIAAFVEQLEARSDYRYDTALVHAANDNRWPTARFLDVVRHWNSRHRGVPMRTATVDDALDVLMGHEASAQLPVLRGEWSDWWSHGHGSTAREVAVYREARTFARMAQTTLGLSMLADHGSPELAEVIGYRRGPVRLRSSREILLDLERVDEDLLLFGEHTWGSWETYRKPHSTFSHSHWNAKAGFAYSAFDTARDLAIEGMFRLAASEEPSRQQSGVLVVNTTASDRTEPVAVEVDGHERRRLVARVPALGCAVVPLPVLPTRRSGCEIEVGRYRAVIDPARGGAVSLVDTHTDRQLVDRRVGYGLGAVIVEQVAPGAEHPMLDTDPKLFHPDHPGPDFVHHAATGAAEPQIYESPDFATITWQTTAAGVPAITTSLTLYADLDLIDLEAELVKPEAFGPESIFVAFPFGSNHPQFLLETAGAVYAAETEQLPDTSKDWYSIQHAVGVNGDGRGLLWGSFDAPLVQLGGFHTGAWARHLHAPAGHVNSWLMNNLHFTNFQARQDGTRRYRYRILPTAEPVSRAEVRRFGHSLLEPLQARQYAGLAGPGGSRLLVQPADDVLAEVRPLEHDRVLVRLRNITAQSVVATVRWAGGAPAEQEEATLDAGGVADVVLRRS